MSPWKLGDYAEHPSTNEIASWQASAFGVTPEGGITAYDGTTASWVTAPNTVLSETEFDRITIMQDYSQREWSLYFNGDPVLEDLGFSNPAIREFSGISFRSPRGGTWYVDSIRISTEAPQFD